ncbi:T9SS type A sorting domain-containing protein [Hymenobacter endophyticus]|uniref:T9SS type A sorting domain-containing protein n=1 Tax=Hymenobacter endophyticus TaxID=3076335 RepID=A0ABU3TMX7_9BACT|nr:T9SS type A sorting domain-containing protein [Hymenobacter endophyticus]MDU0372748.1 T9SS type A sorting domain-containing protein [Hymenobacter endophyticus]
MHLPFLPFRLGPPLPQLICRLTAACGIGLACTTTALAQFPRVESFKNTTTSGTGFRLGGNPKAAVLTAASGTDANGSGYLRLTDSGNNQSGFAIDNSSFPAPSGFSISFEFYSYGGNGADGFSVFLIDADKTSAAAFTIGASGGSLGYAQKTSDPISDGVPNGYVGIGIDEFGNFANPTEGRVGGPGSRPDAVSLRGPGNGRSATDYPYLAGSGSLPFSLDVATVRAQQGDADFRRAYIDVIPQTNGTYQITVRIQHGNAVTTAVNRVTISTPPSNLRIGFSGSTGAVNNFHEIRNLAIVKAPFANDDVAGTKYNVPVTLNILNNDIAQGSNLDPASVDLNPSTTAVDNEYTVAGQGTFRVSPNGVVTFTPSGTFSGIVTIPYTVASVLNDRSSPANIAITVTGADVATTVGGPSSVNPGSSTSYVVTTYNNGQEDAINVIPTLRLPTDVKYVSGGSDYNATTRVVSFAPTTLTDGQSVSNNVVLTFPGALGTYSLVSDYTYNGSVVPDAVAANNSSTLAVTVAGPGNVAGVCAMPGKDGVATLSANTAYNTYYPGTGPVTAGATTIPVGAATGSAAPIAIGDLLLIMQMQDAATFVTVNDNTYGTLSATNTAGRYEYAVAAENISGGSVKLKAGLSNAYTTSNGRFQVIRIPQYSYVTLSGTVTAPAWNGSTGGVLALEVGGEINFTNGTLSMDGRGFRGGAGRDTGTGTRTDFVVASSANDHGSKGEGVAGMPAQVYASGSTTTTSAPTYEDFGGGSYARGSAGTGGGGGTIGGSTSNHAGGGGGGNYGTGATGAFFNSGANGDRTTGGIGGVADNMPSATRLYLGGGGGAGSTVSAATTSSGGTGGGLILLRAGSVSGTKTITANGTAGLTPTTNSNGGGGGGAGGTIVVNATSGLNNLTLQANGGAGGTSNRDGGGGGGGAIFANGSLAAPATTAGAGSGGSSTAGAGNISTSSTIGANCLPTLTTTLRTTTPQVNRAASMSANYVLTISNTGGGYRGLSISPSLGTNGNGQITYASTSQVIMRLPNGSTQPLTSGTDYSISNATASTPTLTLAADFLVPAGASLEVSFSARINSSVANGTAYVSNAGANYLSPSRNSSNGTAAAAGYTSAGGAAAPDAVTITQPLPVTLTSFEAKAAGRDALLTWATAQELNNDRFEVERSLNGIDFEKIGSVKGKGTTSTASTYIFTDAGAARLTAKTLYYRLHQLDLDGPGSYTMVRTVRFERAQGTATLYPNPHQGRFTLDLQALPSGAYQVDILDLAGRRVYHTQLSGGQEHPLLPTLPMGSYIVHVTGQTVNINLPMVKN